MSLPRKGRRAALAAIGSPVAARVLGAAVAFSAQALIARHLGAALYGIWTVVSLFAGVVGTVGIGGLGWAAVKQSAQTGKAQATTEFGLRPLLEASLVGVSLATLLVGASTYLSKMGPFALDSAGIGLLSATALFWGAASSWNRILAETMRGRRQHVAAAAVGQFLPSALFLLLAVIAGHLSPDTGPIFYALLQITALLVATAVSLRFVNILSLQLNPMGVKFGKITVRALREFAGHRYGLATAMAAYGLAQADVWVGASFLPANDIGVYGAGVKLVMLVVLPLAAAEQGIQRYIARRTGSGPKASDGLQTVIPIIAWASTGYGLCWCAFLAMTSAWVGTTVFGDGFSEVGRVAFILAIGRTANAALGPAQTSLLMHGCERELAKLAPARIAAAAALPMVAWLLTGTMYGIAMGAALAYAAQGTLLAVLHRTTIGFWPTIRLMSLSEVEGWLHGQRRW